MRNIAYLSSLLRKYSSFLKFQSFTSPLKVIISANLYFRTTNFNVLLPLQNEVSSNFRRSPSSQSLSKFSALDEAIERMTSSTESTASRGNGTTSQEEDLMLASVSNFAPSYKNWLVCKARVQYFLQVFSFLMLPWNNNYGQNIQIPVPQAILLSFSVSSTISLLPVTIRGSLPSQRTDKVIFETKIRKKKRFF